MEKFLEHFMGCPSRGGWTKNYSSNGFISLFLQYAVPGRLLLLLLDGHSSYFTLELVQTAADHYVIIFCLPPHSTADSQPLCTSDSVFGVLKSYWSQACRDYIHVCKSWPSCLQISIFQPLSTSLVKRNECREYMYWFQVNRVFPIQSRSSFER